MRRVLAALLLSVPLQPLWGVVLCLAVTTPGHRAPEHCADQEMAALSPGGPQVGAQDDGTGPHDCPLADACAPTVIALLPQRTAPQTVDVEGTLTIVSAEAGFGLARLAPPTPPPNL